MIEESIRSVLQDKSNIQNQQNRQLDLSYARQQQIAPSPAQLESSARPIPANNMQQHIIEADKQSEQKHKNSYMYKIPQMDQKKLEELKKLQIVEVKDGKQIKIKQSNFKKMKRYISTLNLNSWYFLAMWHFQLVLGMMYGVGLSTEGFGKRIGLSMVLIYASIIYGGWVSYLSWKKDLIDHTWGYIWMTCLVSLLGSAIGGAANAWYISIIFSLVSCFALTIVVVLFDRNGRGCCFILVMIVGLGFYLTIYGMFIAFILVDSYNFSFGGTSALLALVGICILVILYDLCMRGWTMRTKHEKWEFFCLIYMLFIGLGFGLAGSISGRYFFVEITQIINIVCILNTLYYLIVVVQMKCGRGPKFNILEMIKSRWNSKQKNNPNMMYQMADVLLSNDSKYLKNPRKSIMGKPLTQCTNCLSEQSRFYYQNCKHICVGYQCIVDWLKKGIKKCPICRQFSDVMIEVRRVRDLEFQIQGKYRICN